jgi:hypothetical protein
MGAKGSTLYGPTGPTGEQGSAGQQGITGEAGSKGSTTEGIAGLAGPSGIDGAIGQQGSIGDQGFAGQVAYWNPYKEFNFPLNETSLDAADMRKVNEIADYLKRNPSLQIGIDGTAVRSRDQGLNDARVNAIRAALIDDGVSPDKISTGALGDKDLRRQGRIAVYFTTSELDGSLSKN